MLQITYIREKKQEVLEGLLKRNFKETGLVDEVIEIDNKRKSLKTELDNLLAEQNKISKEIGLLFSKGNAGEANNLKERVLNLKGSSSNLEEQLKVVETELHEKLLRIPNIPNPSVPTGKSAEDNEIIREDSSNLIDHNVPHWDILEKFGLVDFELGNKISGAGFPVYAGKGAKLQRALINFFLDEAIAAGYREYIPPLVVNEASAYGTGQLPDKEGQMYFVSEDNLYLIPTAEVPVTNIYRGSMLTEKDLPAKMVAYTPCFRREAGSYGKDVRGLNRVHQFDKVEIVQIVHPESSYRVLEEMLGHVEGLLQKLELPYRIVKLCGGDMGFTSALTYDFEVYSGGQQKWLEVSSVSNFENFQSNRMQIKFKEENRTRLVHTLNGSALALPRILAALLENNFKGGALNIPKVLHGYTQFDKITL